jgi:hypothetical protein
LGDKDTAAFLPVELDRYDTITAVPASVSEAKTVDIILMNGRRVRCEATADDGAVMRAIRIAEVA